MSTKLESELLNKTTQQNWELFQERRKVQFCTQKLLAYTCLLINAAFKVVQIMVHLWCSVLTLQLAHSPIIEPYKKYNKLIPRDCLQCLTSCPKWQIASVVTTPKARCRVFIFWDVFSPPLTLSTRPYCLSLCVCLLVPDSSKLGETQIEGI